MTARIGWLLGLGIGLTALLVFGSQLSGVAATLYFWASRLFAWVSEPLNNLRLGLGIPILGAFLLGLLAATAPCQLSTNAAAMAWFSRSEDTLWARVGAFLAGKTMVYLLLAGVTVFVLGGTFSQPGVFFAPIRKVMGPLMMLLGLYLLGAFRLPAPTFSAGRLSAWAEARGGTVGAFALGSAFGLAFCPTMFWLFFGLMLPTAVTSSTGLVFSVLFALGTALPLLLFVLLLQRGNRKGEVLSGMRHSGRWASRVAGGVLLLVGLYDTVVFWFI